MFRRLCQTAEPFGAADASGTRSSPLCAALRGTKAAWPRGGAISGARSALALSSATCGGSFSCHPERSEPAGRAESKDLAGRNRSRRRRSRVGMRAPLALSSATWRGIGARRRRAPRRLFLALGLCRPAAVCRSRAAAAGVRGGTDALARFSAIRGGSPAGRGGSPSSRPSCGREPASLQVASAFPPISHFVRRGRKGSGPCVQPAGTAWRRPWLAHSRALAVRAARLQRRPAWQFFSVLTKISSGFHFRGGFSAVSWQVFSVLTKWAAPIWSKPNISANGRPKSGVCDEKPTPRLVKTEKNCQRPAASAPPPAPRRPRLQRRRPGRACRRCSPAASVAAFRGLRPMPAPARPQGALAPASCGGRAGATCGYAGAAWGDIW